MNKTDPFLTYRPLDSDVEAEWTPERSTRVLEHVLSSANSTPGSQRFTATKKKAWAFSSLATAGVATAVAVVLTLSGSASQSSQTTPEATRPAPTVSDSISTGTSSSTVDGNAIVLAGYKLALPADYTTGKVDTNCTSELQLSADEQKRLITTPTGGCPLLVTSVRRDLPSGTIYEAPDTVCQSSDGDMKAGFIGGSAVNTGSGWEVYLPAELPDGSTVYVTIDLLAGKEGSDNLPACDTLTTQVAELAKGIEVTPAS